MDPSLLTGSNTANRPTLMVSSAVYDKRPLLEQIYIILSQFGYEVWMSDKGTIPVEPEKTAFENCLLAVENCDLFLGIISGYYGSGEVPGEDSITHKEVEMAVKLKKRRWFLVDRNVIISRNFVKVLRRFEKKDKIVVCENLDFQRHDCLSDIRVLKMYDCATMMNYPFAKRTGNWVQEFTNQEDVLRFIGAQFQKVQKFQATEKK